MSYDTLMFLHLYTVVPCVFIGGFLLIIKKGTQIHKQLGRIYMILMLFTAIVTLFMPADVGGRVLNHFGWIHLFSFLTIWTVPTAYLAIKKGNVKAHKRKMILLYFGALIIAGGFTLMPGRYLHGVFFG
ncbi:DUF2306 domain-containing protein [Winogradskyella sp. UBA3174]|uniref:DUF2306 domain-containing protein n=1 Tax=Winogradskyella sp. UBA3174 TaxID=1947785 RepID=UPI0025FE1848|nr:DUF2306 domain-containing protein [Winogradskyella sp. UBA3174]